MGKILTTVLAIGSLGDSSIGSNRFRHSPRMLAEPVMPR